MTTKGEKAQRLVEAGERFSAAGASDLTADLPGEVTQLLSRWSGGDEEAAEGLLRQVYQELHKIAAGYLAAERRGHTLQPTALVNEAYLRLLDQQQVSWQNRSHFYGVAAQLIRRILVDYARRRQAAKRGGKASPVPLSEAANLVVDRPDQLVALDEALERLRQLEPFQASVVEYRFFGGLTGSEIAELLDSSPATVQRNWRLARAWLYRELAPGEVDDPA